MSVKEEFHQLIDTIDDEHALKAYYQLIQSLNDNDIDLGSQLTPEQEQLVLLSYQESLDEKNLVSHTEVMKKYAKWLK